MMDVLRDPAISIGGAAYQRLVQTYVERNIPYNLTLELTRHCNLACQHCYAAIEPGRRELSIEDIKRVIQEARQLGVLFVTFIGGDPTVRRGYLDLVAYASSLHMSVQIFTNGTLIDEHAAESLAEGLVSHMGISLYGACAETHDPIVRRPGSFDRTVSAIQKLKTKGVHVVIKFLVMQRNAQERERMRQLARSLDVPVRFNTTVAPRDDLDPTPWGMRADFKVVQDISLEEEGVRTPNPIRENGQDMSCLMGKSLIAVNAYGDVFPCIMVPIPAGNVCYATLSKIWWDSPFLRAIRKGRTIEGLHTCTDCSHRCDCDRCPGVAYMETGDLFGPSPSACIGAMAVRSNREGPPQGQSPDLPAGLIHSDSKLWHIHDILDNMGQSCAGVRFATDPLNR